jgi:hypothetical protein
MGSFSAGHWVALAVVMALPLLIIWALIRAIFPGKGKPMVCTTCGHHGPTKNHTRGSVLIEIVLWLLFIVPGLIYSLWRLSTRRKVCSACEATTLVPADTPAGRRMLQAAEQPSP